MQVPIPPLEDYAYMIFHQVPTVIPKKTLIRHKALESVFQSWYAYYKLSQPQRVLSISNVAFDTLSGTLSKPSSSGSPSFRALPILLASEPHYNKSTHHT